MSHLNNESHRKNSGVLEKLGQKITTMKEDLVDNMERRRHSHHNLTANRMHSSSRTNMTDESLVIEKKPSTPPEHHHPRTSGKNRNKKIYICECGFDTREREKETSERER